MHTTTRKAFDRQERDTLRRRPVVIEGTAGTAVKSTKHSGAPLRFFKSHLTLVGDSRGAHRLVAPGQPYTLPKDAA